MKDPAITTEAGDAWRDHLLKEVVAFLDQNRDAIIERFEAGQPKGLSRQQLESQGLLDFDVAITLHRDRGGDFGLGSRLLQSQPHPLKIEAITYLHENGNNERS